MTGDASAKPKTIRGRVRRRLSGIARFFSRGAKAMAVASVLAFGGTTVIYPEGHVPFLLALLALAGIVGLFASPVVGLFSMLLRFGGLEREGTLSHDERGLLLTSPNGSVRALGSGITTGVVVPREDGFEVVLGLSDGNEISIRVDDEASAEQLLDLAGVGHERRSTRVRWASLLARITSGTVGFVSASVASFALMLSVSPPWDVPALLAVFVVPFLAAGAAAKIFAWREIEVGTDGIAWRYYGLRKLLPMRDVVRVEARGDELRVELADGTQRCFRVRKDGFAEGLRRRIEDVLAQMGAAHGKQSLFARSELAFEDWVEQMRNLIGKGGAFREQPVDVSDAVRVLEDPKADPEMRVGAALALAVLDEPAIAARVRVAADTCVSPKLRVALEEAARGDANEEVVVEAQDELRVERRAQRGS